KYYEYAVKGALQADPEARIGGITPATHLSSVFNTTGKTTRNNRPMLQNWIAYCAQAHLPIHFVTWHSYPAGSPVPPGTTAWNAAAKDIRGWLGESGYKDTELIVTDWPEWKPHQESDTEFKAAWVASGMMSLAASGVSMTHLLQDTLINDQLMKTNGSFGGDQGRLRERCQAISGGAIGGDPGAVSQRDEDLPAKRRGIQPHRESQGRSAGGRPAGLRGDRRRVVGVRGIRRGQSKFQQLRP